MGINLKLRSEILECSLNLEEEINKLLLANLGILGNNEKTRLFGYKAGITFKNKIDLLYDLDIISKKENFDFELLMIFRNKFLHDIKCNSFQTVFEQIDNSVKNKFKQFLNEGEDIQSEDDCRYAFSNLYLKNMRTILDKTEEKRMKIEKRNEAFQVLNQTAIYHIDIFFDFIHDLYLTLEKSNLEDSEVRKLSDSISEKCNHYVNKYKNDKEYIILKKKYDEFLTDTEFAKDYFDIKTINREIEFK